MGKIALIALLVVALVFWLRLKTSAKSAPPKQATKEDELMVVCDQCGVHLPTSESVLGLSAKRYCSDAHRFAARDGIG